MGDVRKSFVAQSIDGGVVFAGPAGVLAMPTNPYEPLIQDWKDLDHGTLAEDGLSISYTRSSKKIKDFDGATYITVQEEFGDGFKAKFYDVDNVVLLKSVFGESKVEVTAATGAHGEQIKVYHSPEQLPFQQAVLATRSGAKKKLYLAELCKVAEVAEVKDVYNDATYYEVTWDVFRDASGNFLVELRDDGVLVSGS